jgi:hypothetical protein
MDALSLNNLRLAAILQPCLSNKAAKKRAKILDPFMISIAFITGRD